MRAPWVRRRYKKARAREAMSLALFAAFGVVFGVGVFFLVERLGA
jgi:nitric oxide reductase large subunit